MRSLTPGDHLLNNIWGEGGLLVDADQRQMLFWGGEAVQNGPHLRRIFLPGLARLWAGWTIQWAMHGLADLARHMNIDTSTLLEGEWEEGFDAWAGGSDVSNTENELEAADAEYETTALTVRWDDGSITDHVFSWLPGIILGAGPVLLDAVRKREPRALPRENEDGPVGGAYCDLTTRKLWVWNASIIDVRYPPALEQRWPGWSVHAHVDGLVRQMLLSGRDPEAVRMPETQARQELIEALRLSVGGAPSLVNLQAAVADRPPGTDRVEVQPGFFKTDEAPLTQTEWQCAVQRLFED